jgi:hypothetical protein
MFYYNNPYLKSFEHGGEHWMDVLGNEVDPSTVTTDGIYFKTDANGMTTKEVFQDGTWYNKDNPPQEENTNNNSNTSNTSNTSNNPSSNEPVEEGVYADHDNAWDYKIIDGVWHTRKKGETGDWTSLADNQAALDKLNAAYPEAISTDNTTKDEEKTDDEVIEEANDQIQNDPVYYDGEFRSPEEANLLSGIGDTGLFDLVKAIDTTYDSFKSENYYDPGTKMDYMKFGFKNTSGEGLYFDEENFMKKPNKPGSFLLTEEQAKEKDIQAFLDDRHKRNPDKYAKVKDFDLDLYNRTGYLDYRKGPFGLFKGEGKQGDMLEKKYSDATHIGFTTDKMGNYEDAFDYLTADPDDPTKFRQTDFDDGFAGIPFDPNNPLNYDMSDEYRNSPKHNPYLDWSQTSLNENIIENRGADGRFSKRPLYPLTPESPDFVQPDPKSDPDPVITSPEDIAAQEEARKKREAELDYIENQLRKSQGRKYGGSMLQAQGGVETPGMKVFSGNMPIFDLQGQCVYNCIQREIDPPHNLSLGMGFDVGKMGDNYTGMVKLTGGYSLNPTIKSQGRVWGPEGYLGANVGGRTIISPENIESGKGSVGNQAFANAVGSLGWKGELEDPYSFNTYKRGRRGKPLTYGLGAYYTHPLMGDQGRTVGGYGSIGKFNFRGGYNLDTKSPEFSLGIGAPIRKTGGQLPKAQFGNSPFSIQNQQGILQGGNTGYDLFGNQIEPFKFGNLSLSNPNLSLMSQTLTTPPEKTEPFFNSEDKMYAYNQSVTRSMNEWDAFTADMNERIQNPSLIQTQTTPFETPQIEIDPDLNREMQLRSDMFDSRQMRTDPDQYMRDKMSEVRADNREFKKTMKELREDFPKYEGTRKNLRDYEKAKELGFEDDFSDPDNPKFMMAEYKDYLQSEEEEKIKNELREEQLNEDNKDKNMSFGDKMYAGFNRFMDSKGVQTFGKIGAGAVRIAKPLNKIIENVRAEQQKRTMMDNAYLSDNMFAAKEADITGSKGDYDANTGIFRPDDKVVVGQTYAMYGGEHIYNRGGEMEIDMNTYKQLVAAGAEIEII